MKFFKGNTYKVAGWSGGERGQISVKGTTYYEFFRYLDADGKKVDITAACRTWQQKMWLKHAETKSESVSWLFFRDKWNEWARNKKEPLSPRTIAEYNYAFDRVEKHICPVYLNDIISDEHYGRFSLKKLRKMISDLEDEARSAGQDNYGVNKVIQCMRVALRWAMNKGYMDDVPIDNLATLDTDDVVVKTNDLREIEMLLKYGSASERAAVLFGFDCSCRPEEICNMRWEKLDLQARFGWVSPNPDGWKPKKGKIRQIRLTERLVAELGKLPRASDYIFINQYGRKYSNGGFSVFYRKFVDRVNEEIAAKETEPIVITGTCKTLRKDYATSRQARGADQKAVSLSMGHADTDVTKKHYTNTQQEELRRLKEQQERDNLLGLDKYEVPLKY